MLAWRARFLQEEALIEAHRRNRSTRSSPRRAVAGLVVTALVAVFALSRAASPTADARAAHTRELDAAAGSVFSRSPSSGPARA